MKTLFLIALLVFSAFTFRIRQPTYADSANDFQAGVQALTQSATDATQALTDATAATIATGTQAFQGLTNAAGSMMTPPAPAPAAAPEAAPAAARIQQPTPDDVMADVGAVAGDLVTATDDFLDSQQEAIDATFDQTETLVGNLAPPAPAPAAAA